MNRRERLGIVAIAASAAVALSGAALLGARAQDRGRRGEKPAMTSTIAFVSTRHAPPPGENPLLHPAERTIEGVAALHMMRKGQVKRLDGRDAVGQAKFVGSLFGVAA